MHYLVADENALKRALEKYTEWIDDHLEDPAQGQIVGSQNIKKIVGD